MKRYKAIVEGVEKFFNVTPDRYDAFIAKHPDAVLVEGPETEEDSKADTETLSTAGKLGFQKDTAESADVVSEDGAQNDMGLPSDDGSLELPTRITPPDETTYSGFAKGEKYVEFTGKNDSGQSTISRTAIEDIDLGEYKTIEDFVNAYDAPGVAGTAKIITEQGNSSEGELFLVQKRNDPKTENTDLLNKISEINPVTEETNIAAAYFELSNQKKFAAQSRNSFDPFTTKDRNVAVKNFLGEEKFAKWEMARNKALVKGVKLTKENLLEFISPGDIPEDFTKDYIKTKQNKEAEVNLRNEDLTLEQKVKKQLNLLNKKGDNKAYQALINEWERSQKDVRDYKAAGGGDLYGDKKLFNEEDSRVYKSFNANFLNEYYANEGQKLTNVVKSSNNAVKKFNENILEINSQSVKIEEQLKNDITALEKLKEIENPTPEDVSKYNEILKNVRGVLAGSEVATLNKNINILAASEEILKINGNILEEKIKSFSGGAEGSKEQQSADKIDIVLNALGKNYSKVDKLAHVLEVAFLGSGSMLYNSAVKGVVDLLEPYIDPETGEVSENGFAQEVLAWQKIAATNKENSVNYNQELQKKSVEEFPIALTSDDSSDKTDYFVDMLINNAPSIAVVAGSMGIGSLAAAGTTSVARALITKSAMNAAMAPFFVMEAGGQMARLEIQQRESFENIAALKVMLDKIPIENTIDRRRITDEIADQERIKNLTQTQKAFNSYAYGGVATLAERFGTLRFMRGFASISKKLSDPLLKKYIASGFKKALIKTSANITTAGLGVAVEEVEEILTVLGQNYFDNLILGDNKSIIEGIDKEFLNNVAVTSFAISGPTASQGIYQAFSQEVKTAREYAKEVKLRDQILGLTETLSTMDKRTKAARNVQKEIDILMNQSALLNTSIVGKLKNLDSEDINTVFENNNKKRQLKKAAQEAASGGKLNPGTKKYIEELQTQFNDLSEVNSKLLNKDVKKYEEEFKTAEMGPRAAAYASMYQLNKDIVNAIGGDTNLLEINKREELVSYINAQVSNGNMTEAQQQNVLDGYDNRKASAMINDFDNTIIVFNDNVEKSLLFGSSEAGGFAAVSPIHELGHIQTRRKGKITSKKMEESADAVILSLEQDMLARLDSKNITEEQYDIFVKRVETYKNQGAEGTVMVDEMIQIISDMTNLGILPKSSVVNSSTISSFVKQVAGSVLGDSAMFLQLDNADGVYAFVNSFQNRIDNNSFKSLRGTATDKQGNVNNFSEGFSSETQQKINKALDVLEEAEIALEEDFDNPQAQKAVEDATDAYNSLIEQEANIVEDVVVEEEKEVATNITAENFIPKKKDPSTKKRSLTLEVKEKIEVKVAQAQKENKKIIAEEKANFENRIAEIKAIPDKELSRTEKSKLIKLSEDNPVEFKEKEKLTVNKSTELKALEKEIAEDLKVPIDKFVNSVGVLFYKLQKPQVRDTVDLNTFLDVVRGDVLTMAIREFKKNTINRQGEAVVNDIEDIIFSRGGRRIIDVSKRLIVGQEKTNSTKEIKSEQVKDVKKIKPSSVLAGAKNGYERAKKSVQDYWKQNEGNKKVENFKGLKSVVDDVIAELFGIKKSALIARSGNLNQSDMLSALDFFTAPLNVIEIKKADGSIETARVRGIVRNKDGKITSNETADLIDSLNERRLLDKNNPNYIQGYTRLSKTTSVAELSGQLLPESTVPDYFYEDGKAGRYRGKATGVGNKIKEALYTFKKRGTIDSGNIERTINDISAKDVLEMIGAFKDSDGTFKFNSGVMQAKVPGQTPEGLRLLEFIKLYGKYITNELSRTETNLDVMTKSDIKGGKRNVMFSEEFRDSLQDKDENAINPLAKAMLDNIKPNGTITMQTMVDLMFDPAVTNSLAEIPQRKYRLEISLAMMQVSKNLITDTEAFLEVYKTYKRLYDYQALVIADGFISQQFASDIKAKKGENQVKDVVKAVEEYYTFIARSIKTTKYLPGTTNKAIWETKIVPAFIESGLVTEKNAEEQIKNKYKLEIVEKPNQKGNGTISYMTNNKIKVNGLMDVTVLKANFNQSNSTIVANEAVAAFKKVTEMLDYFRKNKMEEVAKGFIALIKPDQRGLLRKLSTPGFAEKNPTGKVSNMVLEHETEVKTLAQYALDYYNNGNKSVFQKRINDSKVNLVTKKTDEALLENKKNNKVKDKARYNGVNIIKEFTFKPVVRTLSINEKNRIKAEETKIKTNTLFSENGMSAFDFDDTLATSKSNVLYTMPDGSNGKLTAEQFAKEGENYLAGGAVFDFSEFSKVVKGKKGPLFQKAINRVKKFGNKDMYVITARPANSAIAIQEFLKGVGLDIPINNITGLANSNPQAKADWVVGKIAEGYNDIYFVDDHIGNVKAVKNELKKYNVNSNVQQAKPTLFSEGSLSNQFNKYLEKSTGIESFKKYKSDKAKLKGRFKGKLDIFIPPSAEDFLGLLYQTLNKGELGEAQMKFYEDNLLKPYAKANSALRSARVRSIREFDAIKKKLKIVPKDLKKSFKFEDENGNMKDSLFSKEQAIRVYIWNAQGIEMPNLSQVDLAVMVNHVNAESELKAFADELLKLNRGMKSKAPSKNWMDGNIGIDLQANLNSVGRKKLLEVWQQNVDAIFSEENLNKLEAAYGPEYVKALESSLRRMRTGRSAAPVTDNEAGNNLIMWLNSAVGNIMFFNNRSALLQMLSATNFLNFEDNNIIAAGKAFANQPQYWKDFTMLMNSDYLVDRRDGTRININEADIALIAKQSGITGVIAKILELGFLPTKFADSLAIATGGATFYRTKVDALRKGGMSKDKAEAQAMQEFISVAETSQQSSDQSKISMEQAGSVGKIILAFNNTSSQYSRIIKRSVQDLYNRRGSDKANLARIVYYGGMQNLLFNFMQQAMFAAMWGGEDDEEVLDGKKAKIVNSMADGLLRGMGVKAAIFVAIKNTAIKLYERSKKDVNKDYRYYAVMGMLAVSPPLSSKASKLSKAASAFQYGEDEMKYGKFSLDSPELAIGANIISFATSLPTDRLLVKAQNVSDALDASNEPWERLFMTMGWPKWTLSTKAESDLERKEDKTEIKEAKEKAEFDAMTPLEQKTKALEDLKKFQQVDSLKAYGLTDKEIRLLTREEDRINKILSLEGSEKKGLTPADKAEEELYDLKKKQQVDSLTKYGLTKKQIRDLKYEEDRVNEILRLRKKQKKIKDTLK